MTHGDVRELIPSYALGALEPDSMGVVEEHLTECAFCANLAREATEVAHYMPYGAPYRAAPRGALERLMATVAPEARSQTVAAPEPSRQRGLIRFAEWLRAPVFAPVAAAAVVVLGLASWNMMLMGELSEDRRQMTVLQSRLNQQTHFMVMVSSGSMVTRPLQGTPLAPSAAVRLVMDEQSNSAMLMAMHLPPLPTGHLYQVWLGRQGGRMPACRLTVDQEGDGECMLQLDDSVHAYDSAWITLEPENGPMPNSPGVAKGVL